MAKRLGPLPEHARYWPMLRGEDARRFERHFEEVRDRLTRLLPASEIPILDELCALPRALSALSQRAHQAEVALLAAAELWRKRDHARAARMLGLPRKGPRKIPLNAAETFVWLTDPDRERGIRMVVDHFDPLGIAVWQADGCPLAPADAIRRMAAQWDAKDDNLVDVLRRRRSQLRAVAARGEAVARDLALGLQRLPTIPPSPARRRRKPLGGKSPALSP